MKPVNYVILFPDELRAESLACYGHPLVKTPNIDALAAEGTLFENNYTEHPVCGPARACLATGWYPHVDGRRTYYLLKADHENLYTPLRKAGFNVSHSGKDDMFYGPEMGRVFDEYLPFHRRDAAKGRKVVAEAPYSMLYEAVPDELEPQMGDAMHTEESIDYIRRMAASGTPFCLTVSWLFPHPPYMAPESYYNMYDPAEVPMRRDLSWMEGKPDYYPVLREYREMTDKDPNIYRRINAVYLGMISYVDTLVGRVVSALKDCGIYDDTTIIFCSDHGDYAGDAGQLEKWPSDMSDMITRVPLIIRRPGAVQGQRISAPTQSFDILTTILDYEGIDPRYEHFGVSLKPQLEGAPGDDSRAVYCEGGYDIHEPWCFEPVCFKNTALDFPQPPGSDYYPKSLQQQEQPDTVCRVIMQRFGDWKLNVRTNGQNELYNMKEDPLEEHNLYSDPAYADRRAELEAKLLRWLVSSSDVVPIYGR